VTRNCEGCDIAQGRTDAVKPRRDM